MKSTNPFCDRRLTQLSIQALCLALSGCLVLTTHAAPSLGSTEGTGPTAGEGTLRYQSSQSSPMGDFTETGAPRNRGSAGSRGNCPVPGQGASGEPSVALLPMASGILNRQMIDVPFGETVSSHPTFWFKLAQNTDAIERLDFTLVDEETQDLVTEIRDIPRLEPAAIPEVWGVQWPKTETGLERDRLYRWFLVVECRGTEGAGLLLSGLIQRQTLPRAVAELLPQATTPRERAFLYANNGIWHEAVTELHQALQANPNSPVLQANWTTLLESVGL